MVIIRAASADDLTDVMPLLHQLWPNRDLETEATRVVYMRCLGSDHDRLLCAEWDGRVVGFGAMAIKNSFWQSGSVGYVTTLVVDEACRGRGIGTRLLDELAELAKEHGCTKVELDSGFHREQSHTTYEHYGFVKRAYVFSKDI